VAFPRLRPGLVVIAALVVAILVVAVPSLMRALGSPGEVVDIGDVRTMMSAQSAYQSANGGYYDQPRCLVAPERCLPGYRGPAFLDPVFLKPVRSGFEWTFHAGRSAPAAEASAGRISASSLEGFAVTAVPLDGRRAVCGDGVGQLCVTRPGEKPVVRDGRCELSVCRPLR